jgi:hypothetical protein
MLEAMVNISRASQTPSQQQRLRSFNSNRTAFQDTERSADISRTAVSLMKRLLNVAVSFITQKVRISLGISLSLPLVLLQTRLRNAGLNVPTLTSSLAGLQEKGNTRSVLYLYLTIAHALWGLVITLILLPQKQHRPTTWAPHPRRNKGLSIETSKELHTHYRILRLSGKA